MKKGIERAGGDGGKVARTYCEEVPGLYLTFKDGEDLEEWRERMEEKTGNDVRVMKNGSLRVEGGGSVRGLPGYGEGRWWIQDPSSTIPAKCFKDEASEEKCRHGQGRRGPFRSFVTIIVPRRGIIISTDTHPRVWRFAPLDCYAGSYCCRPVLRSRGKTNANEGGWEGRCGGRN